MITLAILRFKDKTEFSVKVFDEESSLEQVIKLTKDDPQCYGRLAHYKEARRLTDGNIVCYKYFESDNVVPSDPDFLPWILREINEVDSRGYPKRKLQPNS